MERDKPHRPGVDVERHCMRDRVVEEQAPGYG